MDSKAVLVSAFQPFGYQVERVIQDWSQFISGELRNKIDMPWFGKTVKPERTTLASHLEREIWYYNSVRRLGLTARCPKVEYASPKAYVAEWINGPTLLDLLRNKMRQAHWLSAKRL